MAKKCFRNRVKQAFLRYFFAILSIFVAVASLGVGTVVNSETVYAEPDEPSAVDAPADEKTDDGKTDDLDKNNDGKLDKCQDGLGSIAWLVCPTTNTVAQAVDWLYKQIEDLLVVNPVEAKDGAPIYEIWKYCRGVTNVVFIIFLLVVIYSQLTGIGVSNYGLKKALPKLIVAAVLVNLSFLICQVGVDLSNIIGNGLRGLFTNVEMSVVSTMEVSEDALVDARLTYAHMYNAVAATAAGAGLAAGLSFESGSIWMLIPIVLGAIVAVASGLITIALRQAVVALLVMISPLAIVAMILPNTENLFKRWRKLLVQMLVFYPMFSLLFGASALAGFAIMASAKDGFWLMLGMAVQVFPLFFSWKLMSMSGTFLGTVNAKMRGWAARPVAASRAFADSKRQEARVKHLTRQAYTPSLALRQFMENKRIAREAEIEENRAELKERGLAFRAASHYDKTGAATKEAAREEEQSIRRARYAKIIERDRNNMNKGLSQLVAQPQNAALKARLVKLDNAIVEASDSLKMEKARGEVIEYENAKSFHYRMEDAINAHFDIIHKDDVDDKGRSIYKVHDIADRVGAERRYNVANKIMEGNLRDTQYAAAAAAAAYDTQQKIHDTKMNKYIDLTPPTRDVEYRIGELTRLSSSELKEGKRAVDNIDSIISGLRVLDQRGDTDLVKEQLDNILDKNIGGGLTLGTHASQALASFLMFEVKDKDPYMRRFGKYINLETARAYNKNERKVMDVTYDEYIKGYHDGEPDLISKDNPTGRMYAKKDMVRLMEGTSLDGIERTALDNYDKSLRKVYTDENGKLDLEAYEAKKREVDQATAPQFISANMKFLSGSEQIGSAVKAKTGFFAKQDDKTGAYSMVPIWEDEKEAKKLFSAYNTPEEKAAAKKGLEKWYRDQTLQYLRDQTPAQILGLRSDYKEPLLAHLSAAYLLDDDGNEIPERKSKHEAMLNQINNDNFGLTDAGEIAKKRKAAKEALRMNEAGEEFRELLFKKGKLAQIDKTKRSGAANNAKDWVREMLLLDTNNGLRAWIDNRISNKKGVDATIDTEEVRRKAAEKTKREKRKKEDEQKLRRQLMEMLEELKKQQKQEADARLTPDPQSMSVYDAETIAMFTNQIEELWYDVRDESSDEDEYSDFFERSYEFVVENLGEESYVATAYKKYYEENPDGDSYDLRERLIEFLETLLG